MTGQTKRRRGPLGGGPPGLGHPGPRRPRARPGGLVPACQGDWPGVGWCWHESSWPRSLWSGVRGGPPTHCCSHLASKGTFCFQKDIWFGQAWPPRRLGWRGGITSWSHRVPLGLRPESRWEHREWPTPRRRPALAQTPPPAQEGQARRRLSTVSLLPRESVEPSLFTLIKLLTGFWQIGNKSTCSS